MTIILLSLFSAALSCRFCAATRMRKIKVIAEVKQKQERKLWGKERDYTLHPKAAEGLLQTQGQG